MATRPPPGPGAEAMGKGSTFFLGLNMWEKTGKPPKRLIYFEEIYWNM